MATIYPLIPAIQLTVFSSTAISGFCGTVTVPPLTSKQERKKKRDKAENEAFRKCMDAVLSRAKMRKMGVR